MASDTLTSQDLAQQEVDRFKNALVGKAGPKGGDAPIYDPVTRKFIGWQKSDGTKYRADSNNGYAPDYYQGAQTAADPAAQTGMAPASYLSGGGSGGSNMTWQQVGQQLGLSQQDINSYTAKGYTPDQIAMSYQQSGKGPTGGVSPQNAFGISQVGGGQGYTVLRNQSGQQLAQDSAGNYFSIDAQGNHLPVSDADAQQLGFQSANPETQALKQLQQIDPTSEALRSSLGQSYADQLSSAQKPTAAQYQSYLDTFKQVDPEEYAQRQAMATNMDSYLKSVQGQYALGSQLDPVTQMQVEQAARKGQADRGNLYGSGQAAVEAMTTGAAGEQRLQQRQAALGAALGGQQSYLQAGLGLGDTAMQLYQQGLANKMNAQQAGLSYLGSGQTPYQAGASYLSGAENAAGGAAQGGPMYNPASLGAQYTGSAGQAPQYGLDVGAQAQSYYNSLNNYAGTQGAGGGKNRTMGAATGALSGAASGAMAGSAAGPGYGTLIGAGLGAAVGGLGGYYS